MENFEQQTLASIVKSFHPAAQVFEKYNLDFCCKGKRSISDACKEANIDASAVIDEIQLLANNTATKINSADQYNIEELIGHIILKHHFYVRHISPTIREHLTRVATKHGDRHPEMRKVFELFTEVEYALMEHMKKEEMVLFPRIREVYYTSLQPEKKQYPVEFLTAPIAVMETEHTDAGDHLYEIRKLTNNYTPPVGACTTFSLVMEELKAFEEDLHQHVHLENNVLFLGAIKLLEPAVAF